MKFRPQQYSKKRQLVWWRDYGEYVGELNWQVNLGDKVFKKMGWPRVYKIGQHLHYLGAHAPKNVNKKWHYALKRFYKRYRQF